MEESENYDTKKIDNKILGETIGDTIKKKKEKKEEDDKYILSLISINDKLDNEVRNLITLKVNKDKIKKIKDIKYYIIDNTKSNVDLCPCLLSISTRFEDGYICSDVNDTPNKLIKECKKYFPHGRIYVNADLKTKCNCGFKELEHLSKRDIYEMYIEKINKLNKFIEIQKFEKEHEIKDYEEINKEILANFDKEIDQKKLKVNFMQK